MDMHPTWIFTTMYLVHTERPFWYPYSERSFNFPYLSFTFEEEWTALFLINKEKLN